MDVFKFINSKDIREFLKEMNYQFNPFEAAWLIYQCKNATLHDKCGAWRELINTMSDCEMPFCNDTQLFSGLHQFLNKYITLINMYCDEFYQENDSSVYTYSLYFKEDGCWINDHSIYADYKTCLLRCKEEIFESKDYRLLEFSITKHDLENNNNIIVTFLPNNTILNIYVENLIGEEDIVINNTFGRFYFDFPTPFKKGDILCEYNEFGEETTGYCQGPFVLTSITKNTKYNKQYADSSDITAWGYFQNEDGSVYADNMYNYMDLEYYKGKITDKKRILKSFSSFLKEEIDIGLLANAYHCILSEEYSKLQKPRNITKEGLLLAGVEGK